MAGLTVRARLLLTCALALSALSPAVHATAAHVASAIVTLDQAEAAPSAWNATTPPVRGWTRVKLLDTWTRQWPQHDGVVWYHLQWNQTGDTQPVGVLVEYASLAQEAWVNGSLVYRDAHLDEPLSRSWVEPHYVLVDRPLLHTGINTLLFRVSGLAAYQPGFGVVRVGPAAAVARVYRRDLFWRYRIHLVNFAMSVAVGVLFGMIWLLRRRETVFGWYALATLLGSGYSWNYVASSPWPFASTDAWEAMNAMLFFATAVVFCIFLLRFAERRWPRRERVALVIAALSLAAPLVAPHFIGVWRNAWIIAAAIMFFAAIGSFIGYALRTRRADVRVMALTLLVPVLIAIRDLAVFLQWLPSSNYDLGSLASPVTLIGMGFAVAWRFSIAMRRVEGFNAELTHEVSVATTRLADTLTREHRLALANAHANERLSLVRDLHDGFGGSLVGAITQLEFDASPAAQRTAMTLKELRDDLRLVIDTTTHEQDTDLAGLLAPLRHRWSQRFELAGIDSRWQLQGLDGCHLGAMRSLDLLRFMQECLTNVLKHSRAGHVDIAVAGDTQALRMAVRDDGQGFDPAVRATGAGLGSLAKRSARLGGSMRIDSAPGQGARVSLRFPLEVTVTVPTDA